MKKAVIGTAAGALALISLSGVYQWRKAWYPLPAKAKKGRKHIACIGDSITFGAGVKNQKKDSYPAYLQKELGETVQVINYGLSGRTVCIDGDWPYTKEKNYRRIFNTDIDLYIVMLGTNDSKPYNWDGENYEKDLKTFLNRFAGLKGKDAVIVMKPPKAFEVNGTVQYDILEENILKELDMIDHISEELGIRVIDLHSYTENHPEWFGDGVHPNAEGNRNIAEFIAEHI